MSKALTSIQIKILDFIIEAKSKGRTPSLADIAEKFNYKNRSTVQQHLNALEKKNYIKRPPNSRRNIELLIEDKMFVSRPIIGEVAAGNPLTIYPDAIDSIKLPAIVRMPNDSFLLRVKGDSLKDAYIFDGDIVIINPNIIPVNGQIVAAILEDAAVVKRFYKNEDMIELRSENPEYRTIVIRAGYDKFKIAGVVIGIYRSMEKNII